MAQGGAVEEAVELLASGAVLAQRAGALLAADLASADPGAAAALQVRRLRSVLSAACRSCPQGHRPAGPSEHDATLHPMECLDRT